MNTAPPARTTSRPRFTTKAIGAVVGLAVGFSTFSGLSPASAADTEAAKQATVTVRKDLKADPTGQTVRVDGSGFDPAGVKGTVLLPERPAGTFVLFGRMPDVWEPSKGVASSVRMAGRDASSQKWAVLAEDQAAITDDAHTGATVLNTDGTFTTTIKINRNFNGVPAAGNFGIYTYAGDIQNAYAPYETYTPIPFVGDTNVVDLPVVGETPAPTPGDRPDPVVVIPTQNAKRATKLTVKVTKKATTRKTGRATLTVKAGKTNATGKVTVTLQAPGRKAVTKKIRLTRGKAVVKLPKAKRKGTYQVRARYTGATKFKAAKQKVVKYRVKK